MADLRRYYSVWLSDMYAGRIDPVEIADCVALVPRGGAIGQWLGKADAVTLEAEILNDVWYAALAPHLGPKSKVKPRELPEGVREMNRKAAAARAKQQSSVAQLQAQRRRREERRESAARAQGHQQGDDVTGGGG
ncbi:MULTISPECIES: hypothetical protein [unclassified Leucobacter]|uniref:hypothetical protein n=1 Tax=unclassified Leucobacter TaxID=2621730 RepID=UPI0006210386|nr:hypothetical protein [Leucobacter sp. Ag1]KKI20561.1 hypothetical protein XM48_07530 [Leucobacter sp. Ag1]